MGEMSKRRKWQLRALSLLVCRFRGHDDKIVVGGIYAGWTFCFRCGEELDGPLFGELA